MEGRDNEPGIVAPHRADGDAAFPETAQEEAVPPADPAAGTRSLADDLEALVEDARTYLDAELSYQKTRAGFVANRLKKTIVFGVVAAFFAILATIGLTVGLIIALTPLITAWGATAVVVLALLLLAWLLVRQAGKAWNSMMGAMQDSEEAPEDG